MYNTWRLYIQASHITRPDVELSSSVYNVYVTILNRGYTRYTVEGGIVLSLIVLSIMFINGTTQVGYGLAPQFSLGSFNYSGYPALGLEPATKAFLDGLQQKGVPPIYTLSPEKARAVLSEVQRRE